MRIFDCFLAAVPVCIMSIFSSCNKEMLPENEATVSEEQVVTFDTDGQDSDGQGEVKSSYKPIDMSEEQLNMTYSLNAFSLSVFEKTVNDRSEENFVISPLSLAYDLAMCAEGAVGKTASQINNFLGLGQYSSDEINLYFQTLSNGMPTVDSLSSFSSSNSVWLDNSFPAKPSFVESIGSYYSAEANNVDFSSSEAWERINSWCNQKTNGLISNMPLEGYTQMALVNAVSFSGIWGHDFDEDLVNDYFHTRTSDVPAVFMTSKNRYGYSRLLTCRLLSIPYGRGGYSMLIAYPYDGISFSETLSELNSLANRIAMTVVPGFLHELKIKLPKFTINNSEQDFIPVLKSLGLDIPFSEKADFSGISEIPFSMGKVIQKSCIDVNEKGTEAAAVTRISSLMLNPGGSLIDDTEFYVDSPFMFFVMESGSGSILFAGQKVN